MSIVPVSRKFVVSLLPIPQLYISTSLVLYRKSWPSSATLEIGSMLKVCEFTEIMRYIERRERFTALLLPRTTKAEVRCWYSVLCSSCLVVQFTWHQISCSMCCISCAVGMLWGTGIWIYLKTGKGKC